MYKREITVAMIMYMTIEGFWKVTQCCSLLQKFRMSRLPPF